MNRRSFMGLILGAAVAPAIARAEWLMPVRVIERVPPRWWPNYDAYIRATLHDVARGMGEPYERLMLDFKSPPCDWNPGDIVTFGGQQWIISETVIGPIP